MVRRYTALALAGGMLVGCSSTDMDASPGAEEGGHDSAVGMPRYDAQGTSSQKVGSSGGTFSAQGVVLTIPAGALASDTVITIAEDGDPVSLGYTALSSLYSFGPNGTVFLKPVTVSFPLTSADPNATVYWSNSLGRYDELSTTSNATSASASVMHFSKGFVAHRYKPADGSGGSSPADSGASVDTGSGRRGGHGGCGWRRRRGRLGWFGRGRVGWRGRLGRQRRLGRLGWHRRLGRLGWHRRRGRLGWQRRGRLGWVGRGWRYGRERPCGRECR